MAESNVRDLFLRGVWRGVIPSRDTDWVERVSAQAGHDGPLGDYGPLMRSMLDRGVPATDIARFAQIAAYEATFGLLYHLEDGYASYEGFAPEPEERAWAVFEVDPESDAPRDRLPGLHESLLGSDPSGREMRP